MARKATKTKSTGQKPARPIFDSLRKPLAPPGHVLGRAKPDEKSRPAGRKAKHKAALLPSSED